MRDFTVTAETREPLAWQSLIRIPDTPEEVDDADSSPKIIKKIVVPEIDREALAAEVAELEKQVEDMEFSFIDMGEFQKMTEGDWEFEFDDMSDFGLHALREADIWFGLPQALGLELAAIKRVRASTYGVLLSIEPAIAALMGFVILSQRLAVQEIGAILAIVVAAGGASWAAAAGHRGRQASAHTQKERL